MCLSGVMGEWAEDKTCDAEPASLHDFALRQGSLEFL